MSTPTLAARNDIHKSCKTFEAVVNYLNDYSEAVTAIIGIQKKLAKALRDAASTKTTSEVAANALTASATIFDTLCEVDSKFAKLVDNECEGISTEVKKWFKRLSKEERAHDDKVATANGKIKQAGLNYEKRVKKNPADAVDEHARYISLLTTLGAETNQEKYNHSLLVTQRHEATLFSLAGCLSRVADAEWLRVCEGVRRVSPNIGQVGEWRVLCEGNWNGPVPAPLPDIDEAKPVRAESDSNSNKVTTDDPVECLPDSLIASPAPQYASRATTPNERVPLPPNYFSPPKSTTPQQNAPATPAEYEDSRDRSYSVNSIASLGSFPAPPTHFPLPPVSGASPTANRPSNTPSSASPGLMAQPTSEESSTAGAAPRALPNIPAAKMRKESATFLDFSSPPGSPSVPLHDSPRAVPQPLALAQNDASANKTQTPLSSPRPDLASSPTESRKPSATYARGDYVDDGDDRRTANASAKTAGSVATIAPTKPLLERSDTNMSKSSSVVAAMRDKYARSTGPASPPPKDVPRLPLRVSDLASRYDPANASEQSTPRSPVPESGRASHEMHQQSVSPSLSRNSFSPQRSYPTEDPAGEEIARRRQRIQELEELELREQEYTLRMREKEIRERARELEREQFELINARQNRLQVDLSNERARPSSAGRSDSMDGPMTPVQAHPYASSNTMSPPSSRYPQYPSSSQPPSPMFGHPLEKTSTRDSARMQPSAPRPEKPKGWIRRLSMPVMALGDSKKGISSADVASNPFYRSSLGLPEEDGRLRNDAAGASKNRSATNLARR
ncbi:hypothetical protein PsYK624_017550 [Phanerochaete sordida]|uniref:IMD domain-containing protein n=1 Tax=Phanerochaete sordida TaxID=48140 RepID=A0A9P3L827_9APHY|nr:hypothetical protein PsYK624_017550 [Phanerochaete sordida]